MPRTCHRLHTNVSRIECRHDIRGFGHYLLLLVGNHDVGGNRSGDHQISLVAMKVCQQPTPQLHHPLQNFSFVHLRTLCLYPSLTCRFLPSLLARTPGAAEFRYSSHAAQGRDSAFLNKKGLEDVFPYMSSSTDVPIVSKLALCVILRGGTTMEQSTWRFIVHVDFLTLSLPRP